MGRPVKSGKARGGKVRIAPTPLAAVTLLPNLDKRMVRVKSLDKQEVGA